MDSIGRVCCVLGGQPLPRRSWRKQRLGMGIEDPSPLSTGLVTLNFLTSVLASYTSRTWAE